MADQKPQDLEPRLFCCYCGVRMQDCTYTIDQPNRPGMTRGPDLPLCVNCGSGSLPSIHEIHAAILEMDPLTLALLEQAIIRYDKTHSDVDTIKIAAMHPFPA